MNGFCPIKWEYYTMLFLMQNKTNEVKELFIFPFLSSNNRRIFAKLHGLLGKYYQSRTEYSGFELCKSYPNL